MFARFTRCWSCVVVLAATACGEESVGDELDDIDEAPTPVPEPDARGTYLDVYLGPGARICRPTLERLDSEVERIAEALGVPLDSEQRIALHYGDHPVKELCDIEYEVGDFVGGGCADNDGLWIAAQPGAESHEIVHTLRIRHGLFGPRTGRKAWRLTSALGGHTRSSACGPAGTCSPRNRYVPPSTPIEPATPSPRTSSRSSTKPMGPTEYARSHGRWARTPSQARLSSKPSASHSKPSRNAGRPRPITCTTWARSVKKTS